MELYGTLVYYQGMETRKILSENLIALRKERGLSKEKFAELVGLHPTYVSELEYAKRNPTIEVLEKIATATSITVAELLSE